MLNQGPGYKLERQFLPTGNSSPHPKAATILQSRLVSWVSATENMSLWEIFQVKLITSYTATCPCVGTCKQWDLCLHACTHTYTVCSSGQCRRHTATFLCSRLPFLWDILPSKSIKDHLRWLLTQFKFHKVDSFSSWFSFPFLKVLEEELYPFNV